MLRDLATALYPIWIVLFTALFVGIVAWAYWPSRRRKQQMKDYASIPFKDKDGGKRDDDGRREGR
ncbi:MAG: cbb3-type cytochrome c oxidase subunit 3 [Acetobacterales bacterium]